MPHAPAALALLLLAAGCDRAPSAAEDAATYAEVLARAGQDPERELARCAALTDPSMAGDCAAVVAVAAARARGDAGAWCARVPEGKWRDECQFQTAETALVREGAGAALSMCQGTGQFQADCVVHVWRPQLGRIIERMGAADFGARYPMADQLFEQTAAQLGGPEGLESMFWLSFFGTGFRNSGAVDLGRCAPLPAAGQRRCEAAAAVLVTEPLEGLLRQHGQLEAFCQLHPPRATDVAQLLGVAPSTALDQALLEVQPMLCGGGSGPSLSSGLRADPAQGAGR